jgi:hypothetical protein
MKHLTAMPVLLLAACSSAPTTIQPGQWETTTQFSTIEAPGMPEAALTAMRAQANQAQTNSSCITPQQAANPVGDLMNPQNGAGNCTFTDSTFSGGVISVHGSCPAGPGGGQMRMSWEGSYTATTMQGAFTTEFQGGPQSMRMIGTMSGRRTGECASS